MQPLNLMHSSLPGSGYEVKFVLLALFQTRPGLLHPVGLPPVVLDPPVVVLDPPVVVEPPLLEQLLDATVTLDAELKLEESVE
jgi:hypothetical protein